MDTTPTPEEIDAILAAEKKIVGTALEWVNDTGHGGALRFKALLEIGGQGQTGLAVCGYTNRYLTPQDGSLVLTLHDAPIERMGIFPSHMHVNPPDKALPKPLRGLILPARRHRYYAWANNRRVPRGGGRNLRVAEEISDKLDSFAACIQYFCNRARVSGVLPAPPHEPRLFP